MKRTAGMLCFLVLLFWCGGYAVSLADSGRAAEHGSQASDHTSKSVIHTILGSGKVVSAAASVPVSAAGASGAASSEIAKDLKDAGSQPIGEPLEITDETVSVGLPPDKQLQSD